VSQTGTSTTFIYPFKWYSVASSTGTGAKYATTTDYVFDGDSLVATVDQQTVSGNATGTAKTRYIHPDHLGSTNVVTDENGNVVQTLDFYPYGSTRISVATSTNEKRQFIGQFTDDSTLSYLNARFYDSSRGQFLSEDPAFLALGNPDRVEQITQGQQESLLSDPQKVNAYSYGRDNPVSQKDPTGNSDISLAAELFYKTLYGLGVIKAGGSGVQYLSDQPNSQQQASDQAQFYFDLGASGASTIPTFGLMTINPVAGAAIDAGSLILAGTDKYCSSHTCKNFGSSQPMSPQDIIASLPQPNIRLTFSGPQLSNGSYPYSSSNSGVAKPSFSSQNSNNLSRPCGGRRHLRRPSCSRAVFRDRSWFRR
jgi:RHS repeat-associated protein